MTANDRGAVGKLTLYSVQNATNGSAAIENGQVWFTPKIPIRRITLTGGRMEAVRFMGP